MRRSGTKPTDFALASLLSVSGNLAVLEQGRQVHALALSLGLEQSPTVRSALINMYSKCGSIVEASKVFEESERGADIVALKGGRSNGCVIVTCSVGFEGGSSNGRVFLAGTVE